MGSPAASAISARTVSHAARDRSPRSSRFRRKYERKIFGMVKTHSACPNRFDKATVPSGFSSNANWLRGRATAGTCSCGAGLRELIDRTTARLWAHRPPLSLAVLGGQGLPV